MTLTFMLKIAFSDLVAAGGIVFHTAHLVEPVAMGTSCFYEHISSSSLDSWWMEACQAGDADSLKALWSKKKYQSAKLSGHKTLDQLFQHFMY